MNAPRHLPACAMIVTASGPPAHGSRGPPRCARRTQRRSRDLACPAPRGHSRSGQSYRSRL